MIVYNNPTIEQKILDYVSHISDIYIEKNPEIEFGTSFSLQRSMPILDIDILNEINAHIEIALFDNTGDYNGINHSHYNYVNRITSKSSRKIITRCKRA